MATVNVRVERFEPPHFFSFRWHHPDGAEPAPSNALLVDFRLESNGNSTLLRLVAVKQKWSPDFGSSRTGCSAALTQKRGASLP